MKFTIYQESRPGRRPLNEDRVAYSYSRDALLMVVADGMGGHLRGEVAAQIAVQFITEAFQREAKPGLRDPFRFLSGVIADAHRAILGYAVDHALSETPCTTCVACIVQDATAYWAHAGDSRLYLLRRGRIRAQTRDHSRVARMVEDGLITAEDARWHIARNRIFSCLGGAGTPQIDLSEKTPLLAGDTIVLCSDGLWGPLDDAMIARAMSSGNVMQAVPALMNQADVRGGENADNLSLIAIRWESSHTEDASGGVSTEIMPLDHFTTQIEGFSRVQESAQQELNLSDDDIERAIQEINSAIRKYSK
ncbi:MAG: protein phosphatase 2C domain-containing protein [Zoogloeaceae bacterium]|jgi:serine/threonine protein phosphatase PrpC|nr:protein phosphatase 2C domain-containing protein [Zoogloeaceae bacterium]